MRLVVVGHGRMGRQVERLCPEYGFELAGVVDSRTPPAERASRFSAAEVAIDFSTAAALRLNLAALCEHRLDLVIGTTGWSDFEPDAHRLVETAGVGAVVAANFSLGATLLAALVAQAGSLLADRADAYGAWLHDMHHARKRDAPSGTALALQAALAKSGYAGPLDVTSTRSGAIPGTHKVGFEGPDESLVLSHIVRDRATFARGALDAARWVRGKRGWFDMRDVLGLARGAHD